MSAPLEPGATLGVLGAGQLGRMFAVAAKRMGYRVRVLDTKPDTPAAQVADTATVAAFDDLDAVADFARGADALTLEFENIPRETAEEAARHAPLRPGSHVLAAAQDRREEKRRLRAAGLPVAESAAVASPGELDDALARIGVPAIAKTARGGYDGKGQAPIEVLGEAAEAWRVIGAPETGAHVVVEQRVELARELSVIAVRGPDGALACLGPMENEHRHHILDVSTAPADVDAATASEAIALGRSVMEALDVVGVCCTELFQRPDGSLLINEIAPRPHNSGHLTIEAHATSQFEQQVRAVCGLPLGSCRQRVPAAMANLLGDLWLPAPPRFAAALAQPEAALHLYGKTEARPGRKMGHITATGESVAEARDRALAARDALSPSGRIA